MVISFVVMGVPLVIAFHALTFPFESHSQTLQTVSHLTHFSALSLSLGYDENLYNTTYPEMPPLSKMDFVYER